MPIPFCLDFPYQAIGEQTYLQKFSPDTVGCAQSMLDVPDGHWHKGGVTTNLMRFIDYWCEDKMKIWGPMMKISNSLSHDLDQLIFFE